MTRAEIIAGIAAVPVIGPRTPPSDLLRRLIARFRAREAAAMLNRAALRPFVAALADLIIADMAS